MSLILNVICCHQVQELRSTSHQMEAEMSARNAEIHRTEQYVGQMRGRLHRMGSKDDLYVSTI